MASHERNDVGSTVLDHHHHHHHHFRRWNSFSAATLRRKILSTLSCGGRSNKKPDPNPNPITDTEKRVGSSERSDLAANFSESQRRENGAEERREKEERLEELTAAVRMVVQRERVEERENGAKLIRGMAKEDGEARSTLSLLGAIPPLVAMIAIDEDDEEKLDDEIQIEALYALLNLGIGNDLNKAAIVQAGALHKMLNKIKSSNGSLEPGVSEAIVANFLALSALDSNKPIIGTSGAIPFLVSIVEGSDEKSSSQAKQDALRALYNLSISPSNIPLIVETNLIQYLISKLGDMETSERILSILSNVVVSSEGRRSISRVQDVFPILIDVLDWTDSPECQEKASYILMVMAHKSYSDRQRMIEAGIRSALLELTLLGTTLAQKRASRLLECLRVDKGKQVSRRFNRGASAAVSAPICGPSSSSTMTSNVNKEEEDMMSEEKKAVKELVQQSLQNNMRRIVKRANLPQDFVPSEHLKSLTVCSTSKSLPF